MQTEESTMLDTSIDAAARARALPVEPASKSAVKANLQVMLRLAASVVKRELADEAEPAPTFEA